MIVLKQEDMLMYNMKNHMIENICLCNCEKNVTESSNCLHISFVNVRTI